MYKVKWYEPEGIYEASGGASANSLFFESKADHELFLKLWNHFMGKYASLIHYSFTEVSWSVIFTTKTEEEIFDHYHFRYSKSKKVIEGRKLEDAGHILSQAMRLLLSNYVAGSNRYLGKNGSRVKRRFWKFGFMDVEDYKDRIKVLDRMEQLYTQKKEKYRPDESMYDESEELGFACVYRSSKIYYKNNFLVHFCVKDFCRLHEESSVLRYQIKKTLKRHFDP